jgi:hypothetical protein
MQKLVTLILTLVLIFVLAKYLKVLTTSDARGEEVFASSNGDYIYAK